MTTFWGVSSSCSHDWDTKVMQVVLAWGSSRFAAVPASARLPGRWLARPFPPSRRPFSEAPSPRHTTEKSGVLPSRISRLHRHAQKLTGNLGTVQVDGQGDCEHTPHPK